MDTSLFLPNGSFRAGGFQSGESEGPPFSPSDLPPCTSSPDDIMHGTRKLTKREKREKLEKNEEIDPGDLSNTKVELFPGEEEASSKSSVGSPIVVSRTACPYAGVASPSESSNDSGRTVKVQRRDDKNTLSRHEYRRARNTSNTRRRRRSDSRDQRVRRRRSRDQRSRGGKSW